MSTIPGLAPWEYPLMKPEDHPTALQIIERDHVSLHNKVVLITGASAGIGLETVRACASAGARVFVMVRSVDKTRVLLDKIAAEFPQNDGLDIIQCDLDSLTSVNKAANELSKQTDQLNILINNAGIYHVPFTLTEDGFESTFAVDHIAHHLLFKKLAPVMIKSSTPEFHSRVVAVSSSVHMRGDVDFNDINYTHGRQYDKAAAYCQAKLANIWFANHLEKLYGKQGVHGLSLHPGSVLTDSARANPREDMVEMGVFKPDGTYAVDLLWKSVEQGAATNVWAGTSAQLEGKGGLYLEHASISKPNEPGVRTGYSKAAFDEAKAEKLWDWTEAAASKFVKD
jgi:NAD(P)-dependent dehydrogenase (short-subunit alcohol dehydrogenase family)